MYNRDTSIFRYIAFFYDSFTIKIKSIMKHTAPATGWQGMKENWRNDFIAAISVALVALPLSLGIAEASEFSSIAGVFSAIVGGVVATLFKGGHLTINGPGAGLIAAVAASALSIGLPATLAAIIISGVLQVMIGGLKLGKFAEIFPSSVINGVLAAIGVIIISKEAYLGLFGTKSGISNPIEALVNIFYHLNDINPFIFVAFLVGIGLLVFHAKISYKFFHFLPAPIWVLIITIPFVYLFDFVHPHSVHLFDHDYLLNTELLISLPDTSNITESLIFPKFDKINTIPFWVAVLSITLIGTITSLVAAKAVDKLDPYKRKSDLDKDLIGIGMASIASAFLGGLPIMAVIVRSTVNVQNNAKTKFANLYHAILLVFFILLFTPVIQMVPRAALSAILVFTGFKLAAPRVFRQAYDKGMEQLLFLVFTLVVTLMTDQLGGILAGIALTLTVHLLLARVSVGDFYKMAFKYPSNLIPIKEQEYRLELNGIVNFMGLISINKQLAKIPAASKLIIDGSNARLVDLTVLETFEEFSRAHKYTEGQVIMTGFDNHVTSSEHALALKSQHGFLEKPLTARDKRLKANAIENGWEYAQANNCSVDCLEEFQFFKSRPLEKRWNIITGTYLGKNIDWEISDVVFDEGALSATEVYNTTVQVINLPYVIPKFIVEKEGFWDKIFDRIKAFSGYKDIDFKLFPSFSNKFLLEGENEAAIRYFFDETLITFLEAHEIYHIESNGNSLLIFKYLRFAHSDEMTKMVKFSEELIKKIESRVPTM